MTNPAFLRMHLAMEHKRCNRGRVGPFLGLLLLVASCSMGQTQRWQRVPPPLVVTQFQARIPELIFEGAHLSNVIEEINQFLMDSLDISFRIRLSTSGGDAVPPRITYAARNITVHDAVRVVSRLSSHRPVYRADEVVLAPLSTGSGAMPLVIRGRCQDAASGSPLSDASISALFHGEGERQELETGTDAQGMYVIVTNVPILFTSLDVDGEDISDISHTKKGVFITAQSEQHLPAATPLSFDRRQLTYRLDLALTNRAIRPAGKRGP